MAGHLLATLHLLEMRPNLTWAAGAGSHSGNQLHHLEKSLMYLQYLVRD
jgi:hypothetical protein